MSCGFLDDITMSIFPEAFFLFVYIFRLIKVHYPYLLLLIRAISFAGLSQKSMSERPGQDTHTHIHTEAYTHTHTNKVDGWMDGW